MGKREETHAPDCLLSTGSGDAAVRERSPVRTKRVSNCMMAVVRREREVRLAYKCIVCLSGEIE